MYFSKIHVSYLRKYLLANFTAEKPCAEGCPFIHICVVL